MSVTLLKCAPKLALAKVWKPSGEITPAANAAWFNAVEIPLTGIGDFFGIVAAAEGDRRIALVKEAIAPGANPNRLRRRCVADVDKRTGEAYPAGLCVVARRWIVLDVEKLLRPDGIDWRDGDALAAYVRALLPEAFRNAACVWQFSGSSGHPSKRHDVRLHLFFMLDEPVLPEAWKRHFAQLPFIDQSAFDKAKLIFTAAPIIEVGQDPILQRHGFLAGEPVVLVPDGVKARSAQIARGDMGIKHSATPVASAPMPEAAAAFVDLIAKSNVLRSQHPAYRNERGRRLAFCALIRARFGIEDEAMLAQAFHDACIGADDPNAEHDTQQALDWARGASPTGRNFSARKLLCDASKSLHEVGDAKAAASAARLAMVFHEIEAHEAQGYGALG